MGASSSESRTNGFRSDGLFAQVPIYS